MRKMSQEQEEINYLLETVDPKYHDTIARALSGLANWYGDKAYRQIDDWFTIVYGMILDLEDVFECHREHLVTPLNLEDFVAKDA